MLLVVVLLFLLFLLLLLLLFLFSLLFMMLVVLLLLFMILLLLSSSYQLANTYRITMECRLCDAYVCPQLFVFSVLLLLTFSCDCIFMLLPSQCLPNYDVLPMADELQWTADYATIFWENNTSASFCEIDCDVGDRWRLACLATLRMHVFAIGTMMR
jgi:hypothetical protein